MTHSRPPSPSTRPTPASPSSRLGVATDAGDSLALDARTTVRADLARLEAAGVNLGGINGPAVVGALLAALGEDAAGAVAGPDPRLN